MSQCRWLINGPPITWTVPDIKNHIHKLGLKELSNSKEAKYEELVYEIGQLEKWGFCEGRIEFINRFQEQYEYGYWVFNNPDCPHCKGAKDPVCLTIWKNKKGEYTSDQCNSAMVDYIR